MQPIVTKHLSELSAEEQQRITSYKPPKKEKPYELQITASQKGFSKHYIKKGGEY